MARSKGGRPVKITLICVGRLKDEAERAIVARYMERFRGIGAGLGFAPPVIIELNESKAATVNQRKSGEAAEIRKKLPPDSHIFAMDERGKNMGSDEFAKLLAQYRDESIRNLTLVIGGPDGLAPEFAQSAQLTLSLGRFTFPHGLARAILAEQLYRAATILAGHPYHRE